ncbi:MAG TPA: hypothetical protein VF792_13255 [Ktedonobacterales bacterium]
MLTGDPSSHSVTTAPRPRIWPWAAGSILIPLLIISATLFGHRLALQARLAAQVAPAPTLPPITVNAVVAAPGQISNLALDARTQTLVATFINATSARLSGVAFYDSVTGAHKGESAAPGDASGPFALTDTLRGETYLVGAGGVTIFDDATGQRTSAYANPTTIYATAAGLDERLGIIYTFDPSTSDTLSSAGTLNAFAASDGSPIASVKLPAISGLPPEQAPQITVDSDAGRVYVFVGGHNQPEPLLAYNASDLSPLGSWRTPADLALGPFDAETHTLYFGRADRTVWSLDLTALPSGATAQTISPQQIPSLSGASRFGFGRAGVSLVMSGDGVVSIVPAGAPNPYAMLPLVHAPSGFAADAAPWMLPIDTASQLAYLPGDDNSLLIVSLKRPASHAAPNAVTAALIARAGMTRLLPDTNQNPPFLSATTFPVTFGSVPRQYFIHYSDLGWKGPYAGTASLGDVKAGGRPGDYIMTFSITWHQLFLRQHSWTVEVISDGRTRLLSDSGDAIP